MHGHDGIQCQVFRRRLRRTSPLYSWQGAGTKRTSYSCVTIHFGIEHSRFKGRAP
jgi:hypothetical protein